MALDRVRRAKEKRRWVDSKAGTETFSEPFIMMEVAFVIKAVGPDLASAEMLKNLGTIGLLKLHGLLNRTWIQGDFPKAWRLATIVPVN
ncbi:RNA-directed DNA polymerase from mobile element jockey [Biomphalaria glabrata]|nr:RNA-directed DNA polymerase from mobile element jockey-like [Biomphalaria glabrata]